MSNLLSPLLGAIGSLGIADLTVEANGVSILYGHILDDLLGFVLVAAAVFLFVVRPIAAARLSSHFHSNATTTQRSRPAGSTCHAGGRWPARHG